MDQCIGFRNIPDTFNCEAGGNDYAHARNYGKYMYHSNLGLNVAFSYISQSGFYCLNPHIDGRRAGGGEDGRGGGWRSFCNPKEFYKGIQSLLQKQLIRYFKTFR